LFLERQYIGKTPPRYVGTRAELSEKAKGKRRVEFEMDSVGESKKRRGRIEAIEAELNVLDWRKEVIDGMAQNLVKELMELKGEL
jgi:hypothetical protein